MDDSSASSEDTQENAQQGLLTASPHQMGGLKKAEEGGSGDMEEHGEPFLFAQTAAARLPRRQQRRRGDVKAWGSTCLYDSSSGEEEEAGAPPLNVQQVQGYGGVDSLGSCVNR